MGNIYSYFNNQFILPHPTSNNFIIDGNFSDIEFAGCGKINVDRCGEFWEIKSDVPNKISTIGRKKLFVESENNFSDGGCNFEFGKSSGKSACIINGKTYVGNNVSVINNDVYIDGVKQNSNNERKSDETKSKEYSKLWKVKDLQLSLVSVSGSNDLTLGNNLMSEEQAKFVISGSGNIKSNYFFSKHIEAVISGSGDINFSRSQIDNLDAVISGSGNISNFSANICSCFISGSGNVSGYANKVVKVISGSGSVDIWRWFYSGDYFK